MRKNSGLIVCLLLCVFRLQATVRYVNLHATGSNDGTSWVNAYTDLQAAMTAAGRSDSIFVATATYQPASGFSFALPGDEKVFGGFMGTETNFNQRKLANKATLLGNGKSVISNVSNHVTGVWDGFIITGGSGSVGGGIANYSSSVTIRNCIISGNTASAGGGIYNYLYSAPTIMGCVISGNEGCGIYNDYISSAIVTGNISLDPNFVAPGSGTAPLSGGDYRLNTNSSAISAGNNSANLSTTDLVGNRLTSASGIEMGAYENMLLSRVVYVDSSIAVSGDGSSWTKAYKTVSDALKAASLDITTVDSILVAKGTYYPTGIQNSTDRDSSFLILRSGIKVYGGYAPGGSALRDYVANPTILSGNIGGTAESLDNSMHVLVVAGINKNEDSVVLDGLTLSAAASSTIPNSTKTYNGVAVLRTAGGGVNLTSNQNENIAFRNCIFSDNIQQVSTGGGGMYNEGSSPFVSNCIFTRNGGNCSGGGMFNVEASPIIDLCSFLDNAVQGSGGGIVNISNSNSLITNCLFQGNSIKGTGGAGIFNSLSASTIIGCTFNKNETSNLTTNNTGGAGIYNANCSPVITQCIFTDNLSKGLGGGAIFNLNASTPITNCQFLGNRALNSSGAGGALFSFEYSAPVLTNCIFSGNYTNGISGGGALGINTATVSLINCTLSGNYSNSYAGVIQSYGATADILIRNTIMWGNGALMSHPDILTESSSFAVVMTNSDIQSYPGGLDGNINGDPLFVDAPAAGYEVNGGDYSLQLGSPAVNTGNNAFNVQTTDIAGNPRVFGAAIDMGAYELQQATVPVTLTSFNGQLQAGQASLQWKTGVESGFNRFEVEKSVNGAEFTTVAVISPKGSNSSYSYTGPQTEPQAFYRLKMIEGSGHAGFSEVIMLKQHLANKLEVYPNPASDYIQVSLAVAEKIDINVYNGSGILVKTVQLSGAVNKIDIRSLPAGVYFLVAGGRKTKFVKQ